MKGYYNVFLTTFNVLTNVWYLNAAKIQLIILFVLKIKSDIWMNKTTPHYKFTKYFRHWNENVSVLGIINIHKNTAEKLRSVSYTLIIFALKF
jgi:hypothetical protein